MPTRAAVRSHTHGHKFPLFCLGQVALTSMGKSMPMRVVACSHTHWHTFPITLSGPCGPDKVGEKYATACGNVQSHAVLPYLAGPRVALTGVRRKEHVKIYADLCAGIPVLGLGLRVWVSAVRVLGFRV